MERLQFSKQEKGSDTVVKKESKESKEKDGHFDAMGRPLHDKECPICERTGVVPFPPRFSDSER